MIDVDAGVSTFVVLSGEVMRRPVLMCVLASAAALLSPASASASEPIVPVGLTLEFNKQVGVSVRAEVKEASPSSVKIEVTVKDTECDGYWAWFYILTSNKTKGGNKMRTASPAVKECGASQTFILDQARPPGEPIALLGGCPRRDEIQKDDGGKICENLWVQ